MTIRTPEDRKGVIESGKRLGVVIEALTRAVRAGVTTRSLDELAEKLVLDGGDKPAFKGYTPDGAGRPYPTTLCISINDEVVHGIASPTRTLKDGDIVSLDMGLTHDGYISDSAITIGVGTVSPDSVRLMRATDAALEAAILVARPGARVGDISHAIQQVLEHAGVTPVRDLGGHGVGLHVHEEPWIGNTGHPGTGPELTAGMVLAIEPIATLGKASVILGADGYTYRTRDGSKSSHHEHTILIDKDETMVLTRRPSEKH